MLAANISHSTKNLFPDSGKLLENAFLTYAGLTLSKPKVENSTEFLHSPAIFAVWLMGCLMESFSRLGVTIKSNMFYIITGLVLRAPRCRSAESINTCCLAHEGVSEYVFTRFRNNIFNVKALKQEGGAHTGQEGNNLKMSLHTYRPKTKSAAS